MSITSEELKNLLINNQLITEEEFQKVAKEAERTEKNVIDLMTSQVVNELIRVIKSFRVKKPVW
jgi:TPP-dependent pyruvate/acetoin dehydrogenase alpha subunit